MESNASVKKLVELYCNNSKHSSYQVLPSNLRGVIELDSVVVSTRYEIERLSYINKFVSFDGMEVVDVGGNTGFFSFESLSLGAKCVDYYEGNKEHSEFVRCAAEILGQESKVRVSNSYIELDKHGLGKNADVMFLLNVLHHIGDDYGDGCMSKESALSAICGAIRRLSEEIDTLIFQLGFNWKGDVEKPLFDGGTKAEMIDFVERCADGVWEIRHIGVPVKKDGRIGYVDLDEINVKRDDSLGEFLNRPLFIMKNSG